MNYIKETNAFYEWLVFNPLPTGVIALWHALMSINNKTNWVDEFTVANLTLQALTGLSRQGLDRARNDLIIKGRISYKKGTSNKAGKYKINAFECQKIGTEHDTQLTQNDTQSGHKSSTLNKHKLNETKTNIKESKKEGIQTFNDLVDSYTTNQKLKETLLEYIKMRINKKAKPTNKALDLVFMDLDKYSGADEDIKIKILENSIKNNWTGVFAIKEDTVTKYSEAKNNVNKALELVWKAEEEERGESVW